MAEKAKIENKMVIIKATKDGKKHMEPGKEYEVGKETAKDLIDKGWAEKVKEVEPEAEDKTEKKKGK